MELKENRVKIVTEIISLGYEGVPGDSRMSNFLICDWIYRKFGYYITVFIGYGDEDWFSYHIQDGSNIWEAGDSWSSEDEARENGILKAIKLIKDEKNKKK